MPDNLSLAEIVAKLPSVERDEFLSDLTDDEAKGLEFDWRFWGRPNQFEPVHATLGDKWATWLILAGRGFGKTRAGAEFIRSRMCGSTPLARGMWRHAALIAETAADARDVMVADGKEGSEASGILPIHPKDFRPLYEVSKRRLTWPNGATATIFNATEPEQLRGPQFDGGWLDELCFVAGTLIASDVADIPIESIRPGMLVWTRRGLCRVINAGETNRRAEIWRLTTQSGNTIEGTEFHPIFVDGLFVPLSLVQPGGCVCLISSFGAEKNGTTTRITTKIGAEIFFIARSIKTLMDLFRRKLIFTTKTKTRKTTIYRIWSRFHEALTFLSMSRAASRHGIKKFVAETHRKMCGANASLNHCVALNAETSFNQSVCGQSSVAAIVPRPIFGGAIQNTTVIAVEKTNRREIVFNLEVERASEYFANGILVHNCKWRYAKDTWDNLQFGLRTGDHPQVIITTTPKPILLLKEILTDPTTVITRGSTLDNRANLAPRFLAAILRKYEGTRLGRQEINAEVLDDIEGALWKRSVIDALRIKLPELPELQRIVVAIDPATSSNDDSNETGLVVAGLAENGHAYVLDDCSGIYAPNDWASEAISLYHARRADRIIGERNNGGEMIENTIRMLDPNVSYKSVWASKGKFTRAEPVSALYEQGKVHHVGSFAILEDQMCSFQSDMNRKESGYSPDRMDALVWALTELMVDPQESRLLFG